MSKISESDLLVLQALRVKGFVDTEAVAETVGLSQEDTLNMLNQFAEEGRVSYREGRMVGWMITSEGRSYGEQLLANEVDSLGIRLEIETSYKEFSRLNNDFKEYWSYQIEKRKAPSDEELKYLIEDAVKIRTRSDVPLGIYLSGGLDSTILTYLVKPQHTWTVGFKELNEFNWGRLAADDLGSQHHETLVDKETFVDVAKKMIASRKEPLCVPNEVLIYLMKWANAVLYR